MRVLEIPVTDEQFETLKRASEETKIPMNDIAKHLLDSGIVSLDMPGELVELNH